MTSDPQAKAAKEEVERDTRDVSHLWNEAVRQYNGTVGVELKPKFADVPDMIKFGSAEMEKFHKFRHRDNKVAKLRGLFKDNLEYIRTGAEQLASAAAPVFPPALAIGTAFTYLLTACKLVSADYDVVIAFFEDMNSFLQRITIIETRMPKYPAYRNSLMDVFTSLLNMCGFATQYIELGRFKKWVINLVKGEDTELGDARKVMDTSLSRLQHATSYAILGNTEEMQRMDRELKANSDKQLEMMQSQKAMLDDVLQKQDSVHNEIISLKKLLMTQVQPRDNSSKSSGAKAVSKSKPPTSNRVRSFFDESLNPETEFRNIKDSFVPDTGTWIFAEDHWAKWMAQDGDQTSRILAISGPPGSGKSHLAASAYEYLQKHTEDTTTTCVTHFYFRESTDDLSEFVNAICWTVIQIAEQNAPLCGKINFELSRDDLDLDKSDWQEIWSHLIVPLFPKTSQYRLRIVLDGLDELEYTERDDLFEFLKTFQQASDLNIKIICTLRPDLLPRLQELEAQVIEVTKEKQSSDLKALIWNHLNYDSGLRKFSRYVKQRISTELEEKADCMLYAEHMLRQFNSIGREPLVLRRLEHSMPENLRALYEEILADICQRATPDQQRAMKTLLSWLAFSYRLLTLSEAFAILELVSNGCLDLEAELQGQHLARLLKIADSVERTSSNDTSESALTLQTGSKTENTYDDGDLPLKFQERSMGTFFREATDGELILRTPSAEGHREIFLLSSQIICGKENCTDEGLKKYASAGWAWHLSCTELDSASASDQYPVLEALGNIMTNQGGAAAFFEKFGIDYDEINDDFEEDALVNDMVSYAKLVKEAPDGKLSLATSKWAEVVLEDKHNAFVPLSKAHITSWYSQPDRSSTLKPYKFVRTCIALTGHRGLVKRTQADEEEDDTEEDDKKHDQDEVLAISNAFDDVLKDGKAHWAIGVILLRSGHSDAARLEAEKSLAKVTDPIERSRSLNLLTGVHYARKDYEAALSYSDQTLSNMQEIPPEWQRRVYRNRAMVEKAQQRYDGSISYYEKARMVEPYELTPGYNLQDEFSSYVAKKVDADMVGIVKKWNPLERVTWMTWRYDSWDGQHEIFHQAAIRAGEHAFVAEVYDEVLDLLDHLNASAPLRYQFAKWYWKIGDVEACKTQYRAMLDSDSTGGLWPFTDEDPTWTLSFAIHGLSYVLFEEFRTSTDPALKRKLLEEAKHLDQTRLGHCVSSNRSDFLHYSALLAKMVRKMGTGAEFQALLEPVFAICYDSLVDTVSWNDWTSMVSMAELLSMLGGLHNEAEFIFSAQFSSFDPPQARNNDEEDSIAGQNDDQDEEEEGGSEGSPGSMGPDEDDGMTYAAAFVRKRDRVDATEAPPPAANVEDLSDSMVSCDGECEPRTRWTSWAGGKAMYMCLYCHDTVLCEECYHKRQLYNLGVSPPPGITICGQDHKYLRGPIKGWKGMKDGIVTIEGQPPIKFMDWLVDLKENKWKKAWEKFWLEEA